MYFQHFKLYIVTMLNARISHSLSFIAICDIVYNLYYIKGNKFPYLILPTVFKMKTLSF